MNVLKGYVLLLLMLVSGCTGLKDISCEDPLFIGNEFVVTDGKKKAHRIIENAGQDLYPRPNTRFLWMRPALARFNMLSDSARKKNFWKNKIDEPVLMSQSQPDRAEKILQNRIFHEGYFHNLVEHDTLRLSKKKAKYQYNITLNSPYKLGTISFPPPPDELNRRIAASKENSLLKTGDRYSLKTIKEERTRIDQSLKDQGYLYFNPEFLLVRADTVSEDHQVNLTLLVKPSTPPESREAYTIDKIYLHDDYSLEEYRPDTLNLDPYYLLSEKNSLSFEVFNNGLFIEPGQLYSKTKVSQTMRYLNSLPIIRSSSIRFTQGAEQDKLNAQLYFTKRKQFAYTVELNAIFRSTNYFGPGVIFSYSNRNVKQGANLLKVNLRGRFEVQIADNKVNPAYELGLELSYALPRFYPSFSKNWDNRKLPQTILSTGYNLFNRLDLYLLNSIFFDLGYKWRDSEQLSHRVSPLEMIFTQIPESFISEEFQDYLDANPGVRRSFGEQFVLGAGYEITYNPQPVGKSDIYLNAGVDLAGNLLYGTYSIFNAEKNTEGRYNLFGVPFSQYLRTRLDFRHTLDFNENSSFTTRLVTGIGYPFGNSEILPYIKQFYVGGTNSLRSFIARSVGPGSEEPPEGFRDLTGDIRVEMNMEYRFTIAGNFKSALFLDVGNIWLFNEDETRPNGVFKFDKFLDELAVSAGWGLRWDFDFVVARLDFAYTLRTPYLPAGERWTDKFDFWDPTINIAIGYPF